MEQTMLVQYIGTALFALAVLHTFVVKKFIDWSHHYPKDSFQNSILHLLGEVEVVFGFWAAIMLTAFFTLTNVSHVKSYMNSIVFTEPMFVFCIMVMCATRPILFVAEQGIQFVSQIIHKVTKVRLIYCDFFVVLTLGPLTGSFITEPAAMTVTAFLLLDMLKNAEKKLLFATLAILFVSVSVGGALTPFAAPPILMVAQKWGWDQAYVFAHLGAKSIIAVVANAILFLFIYRKQIDQQCESLSLVNSKRERAHIPLWVNILHILFVALVVMTGHYTNIFVGVFLFFIGLTTVTKKYQESLKFKEALLVAFFLGGIMVFGPLQKWWLEPVLKAMSDLTLFFGATALTAITDNAALTFLGSQVEGLSETSKLALVEGALAGGGLTIIANAPNAAGFAILSKKFGGVLDPIQLLLHALVPTTIVVISFQLWV